MKVFILSDGGSIHTKRWVNSLAESDINIFLFSFHPLCSNEYEKYTNIKTYSRNISVNKSGFFNKFRYLSLLFEIKKRIKEFKPDLLHAHYASSYGLLGALVDFHPYIISVWGSDVYDFPNKNILYKKIFKFNLRSADQILSTSQNMANEIKKYTNKQIAITPFGVDVDLFCKANNKKNENKIIIGNVKALAMKYGIDILIKAFKIIITNNPSINILLEIIGDGPEKANLIQLTHNLELQENIHFLGKIPNNQLPEYYNRFSIFVSPSILNSESFGVVAVEAMSCECPVVVSDTDGFKEVVIDGVTGFVVPKKNIIKTAEAIQKILDNPDLGESLGKQGRMRVLELYNWKDNVSNMLNIYNKIRK